MHSRSKLVFSISSLESTAAAATQSTKYSSMAIIVANANNGKQIESKIIRLSSKQHYYCVSILSYTATTHLSTIDKITIVVFPVIAMVSILLLTTLMLYCLKRRHVNRKGI